ncbi:MAG TPA: hypothetical protein VD793_05345 [Gemmatimonadales bacterium]|nr:hypothetical protein [Gemmatimonadales bacterium]
MKRLLLTAVLASQSTGNAALAQKPRGSILPAGADTNDANAFYQFGATVLAQRPRDALAAFQWARRLAPDWADPLYGEWIASLLSRRNLLRGYMEGSRAAMRSKEIRTIDSLYYHALTLNPFMYRRFDRLLFDGYFDVLVENYQRRYGRTLDAAAERHYFDQSLAENWNLRGWLAYADGRFDHAIKAYGSSLAGAKYKAGPLAARARAAFLKGDYAAALTEMKAAIAHLRDTGEDDLVFVYDSKALFEHSVAVVHEMMGDRRAEVLCPSR